MKEYDESYNPEIGIMGSAKPSIGHLFFMLNKNSYMVPFILTDKGPIEADGRSLNISEYPILYKIIGKIYMPDFRLVKTNKKWYQFWKREHEKIRILYPDGCFNIPDFSTFLALGRSHTDRDPVPLCMEYI